MTDRGSLHSEHSLRIVDGRHSISLNSFHVFFPLRVCKLHHYRRLAALHNNGNNCYIYIAH